MADLADIPRLDKIERLAGAGGAGRLARRPGAPSATLLDAYRGGRMHHAWLIGGPKGIGKATLAYRFARFAFAHPDPARREVTAATDLSVAGRPSRRSAASPRRAHPNLLAARAALGRGEQALPDRADRRRDPANGLLLRLDQRRGRLADRHRRSGRRHEPQRRQRAPEGARGAAGALAVLPDRRHAPGRLLPTIRSRTPQARSRAAACRGDRRRRSRRVAAAATADSDISLAARLAEGSLRRAILLVEEGGIETYRALHPSARPACRQSTSPACTPSPTRLAAAAPTTPITASSTCSATGSAAGSAAKPEPDGGGPLTAATAGRSACEMGGGMGKGRAFLGRCRGTTISTGNRSSCPSS